MARVAAAFGSSHSVMLAAELQDWLRAEAAGASTGPSSWDGLAATIVASTCHEALRTGARTGVPLDAPPGFYAKPQ